MKVEDVGVIHVGSVISFWSPYTSEILISLRVSLSYLVAIISQFINLFIMFKEAYLKLRWDGNSK